MADLSCLVRLIRPINCAMVGFAVLVGEAIVFKTLFPLSSILGFVTGFTITGASMVSNDYWDLGVDRVNNPDRPIPSGRVKPREAIALTVILSAIGLGAASVTYLPTTLILASGGLGMFLLYNYRAKQLGLLGNILVSASIALPLVYGGMIQPPTQGSANSLALLVLFDVMIFLSNTGREVTKGICDVEGDRVRAVSTVALKRGERAAALTSAALYLSAVAMTPLPWLLGLVGWLYLPLVAVTDIGFIASSFILLRDYSSENALKVKRIVLIWMLLGLLSFVAGAL
ncbi:UbiA family prenyltransferase [Candidatus Bathyarchaeota archaeon]|nr:UbiA family prenyltransferase [Candidatus Bathyarchaeota archaeon]